MFGRSKSRNFGYQPYEATDEIVDDLRGRNLQRIDEAAAVPRPAEIDRFHVEDETDERAEEQRHHFGAKGLEESRPPQVRADERQPLVDATSPLLEDAKKTLERTGELFREALSALGKHRRRGTHERRRYYLTQGTLLGGDIGAISGAALMFGEVPWMAVSMGISSGMAAVTSGLLAREVADIRLARKRAKDPEELTEEEQPYAHLFKGATDAGEQIVKYVLLGGATVALLVLGSVFGLRTTTEGATAGIAFGCLAAAIAVASWTNTYAYACEVSDYLDNCERDHKRATKRLQKLAGAKPLRVHAASTSEAESIRQQNEQHGEAAARAIKAEGHRTLADNPGVAGHGYSTSSKPGESEPAAGTESSSAPATTGGPLDNTVDYDAEHQPEHVTEGNGGGQ